MEKMKPVVWRDYRSYNLYAKHVPGSFDLTLFRGRKSRVPSLCEVVFERNPDLWKPEEKTKEQDDLQRALTLAWHKERANCLLKSLPTEMNRADWSDWWEAGIPTDEEPKGVKLKEVPLECHMWVGEDAVFLRVDGEFDTQVTQSKWVSGFPSKTRVVRK